MKKLRLIFLHFVIFCSIALYTNAQEEKYIGLFVYNFTKYFDWPENTKSGDFIVQVLGHESVYTELSTITAGKKVGSQGIKIQKMTSPDEITTCHMVFIGHWQSRHLPAIVEKLEGSSTLIISEMEGMLDKGSIINFVIRDGTIKFEMNAGTATRHQLKIDQRIRELAYRVID